MAAGGTKLAQRVAAIEAIRTPSAAPSGVVRPTGGKHVGNPAAVIYDRDLTYFTSPDDYKPPYPMANSIQLHACGMAVRKQQETSYDTKKTLEWCASLEYLVVVVTGTLDFPSSYSGVNFKGGKVDGHVYVYELPSGKAIGGYSFKGASSASVMSDEIESDFRTNYAKALSAGLAKADPGETLGFVVPVQRE